MIFTMVSRWCQQSQCGNYTVTFLENAYSAWKRGKIPKLLYCGKREQDAYEAIRKYNAKLHT